MPFFLLMIGTLAAVVFATDDVQAKEPLQFIFITCCKDEAFFRPVKKGMQEAAAAMNVQCEFTGTDGVDLQTQAELVRQAIADGYDGIALNIIDPHAFDGVIAEALNQGIPVVAFNVDAQPPKGSAGQKAGPRRARRLSAVCQNFLKAGRILGEKAAEFVPQGGKVLLTQHDRGISALDERLQGIQEALKTRGVTWKVICTTNDPQKAAQRIAAELKADPQIRWVLGTGQTDTEAAGLVIEREFPKGDYRAAGFDLSPEILRLIQAGVLRFSIDQQPYSQGFYPVVQLALYCRYGIRPSDIDAGAGIVAEGDVERIINLTREHYR
jgi:simple sugar transport system substrate-binding protein